MERDVPTIHNEEGERLIAIPLKSREGDAA